MLTFAEVLISRYVNAVRILHNDSVPVCVVSDERAAVAEVRRG